jgi:hypothetical protein
MIGTDKQMSYCQERYDNRQEDEDSEIETEETYEESV